MKRKRTFSIRVGPIGLSLVAAALTAVGFAAVSLAANDNGSGGTGGNGNRGANAFEMPAPPPGAGAIAFGGNLSDADRQKMEDFRKCMEDNGAPGPPTHVDPSKEPPDPPSAADREKLQKAFEACKDKLPADLQKPGPPRIGTFRCGPPPGAPNQGREQGQNQDQSNGSGTQSSGSS